MSQDKYKTIWIIVGCITILAITSITASCTKHRYDKSVEMGSSIISVPKPN